MSSKDQKYQEIIDFLNGKTSGYKDTELAVEFLHTVIEDVQSKYGFNPLDLQGLYQTLTFRDVDLSQFLKNRGSSQKQTEEECENLNSVTPS